MKSLLIRLIDIRFRKFVAKGDYIAMLLVSMFYIGIALLGYFYFTDIRFVFYLVFTDSLYYHFNRKDLELLKVYRRYKLLLFGEYLFYSFPFLLTLFFRGNFIQGGLVMGLLYFLPSIPRMRIRAIKYPFSLVTPFWTIVFRRYKLVLFLPIIVLFCVMGYIHENDNLVLFSSIMIGALACLPAFEREQIEEIKRSNLEAKAYLDKQLRIEFFNTLKIVLLFCGLVFVLFQDLNLVFLFSLSLLVSFFVVITKYAFFRSRLKQQLFVGVSVIGMGLPVLLIPYLYRGAIRELKEIKDA